MLGSDVDFLFVVLIPFCCEEKEKTNSRTVTTNRWEGYAGMTFV